MSPLATNRIAAITLDERSVVRRSPEIESERNAAIADLLHENSFAPASGQAGPFALHLAIEENRPYLYFVLSHLVAATLSLG